MGAQARHRGIQLPERLPRCPRDQTALSAAGRKSRHNQASSGRCLRSSSALHSCWTLLQEHHELQPPVRQPVKAARVGRKTRLGRRRLRLLLVLSMGALGNKAASSPDIPFYHTSAELPDPPYHIQISQALYALINVNVELVGSLNFSRIFSFSFPSECIFAVFMQVRHAKKLLFYLQTNSQWIL